jgi:hypothetical protein
METAIYGPGTWFSLHLLAYHAADDRTKRSFLDFMDYLRASYPCAKCRKHMNDYILAHPIQSYWNEPHGFFRWSWLFHNDVNRRLGKPLLDYDTALSRFGSGQIHVCSAGCEEESSVRDWRKEEEHRRQIPRTQYLPRYRGYNY